MFLKRYIGSDKSHLGSAGLLHRLSRSGLLLNRLLLSWLRGLGRGCLGLALGNLSDSLRFSYGIGRSIGGFSSRRLDRFGSGILSSSLSDSFGLSLGCGLDSFRFGRCLLDVVGLGSLLCRSSSLCFG